MGVRSFLFIILVQTTSFILMCFIQYNNTVSVHEWWWLYSYLMVRFFFAWQVINQHFCLMFCFSLICIRCPWASFIFWPPISSLPVRPLSLHFTPPAIISLTPHPLPPPPHTSIPWSSSVTLLYPKLSFITFFLIENTGSDLSLHHIHLCTCSHASPEVDVEPVSVSLQLNLILFYIFLLQMPGIVAGSNPNTSPTTASWSWLQGSSTEMPSKTKVGVGGGGRG